MSKTNEQKTREYLLHLTRIVQQISKGVRCTMTFDQVKELDRLFEQEAELPSAGAHGWGTPSAASGQPTWTREAYNAASTRMTFEEWVASSASVVNATAFDSSKSSAQPKSDDWHANIEQMFAWADGGLPLDTDKLQDVWARARLELHGLTLKFKATQEDNASLRRQIAEQEQLVAKRWTPAIILELQNANATLTQLVTTLKVERQSLQNLVAGRCRDVDLLRSDKASLFAQVEKLKSEVRDRRSDQESLSNANTVLRDDLDRANGLIKTLHAGGDRLIAWMRHIAGINNSPYMRQVALAEALQGKPAPQK